MQFSVFECLIMFDCLSVQFPNVWLSLIGKILGWLSSITKTNPTIEWLEFDWVWLQNVRLTMPGIWESNLPRRFVAVTDCSLPFVTSTVATNHQRTPSMYVSRKFTIYISRDFKNVAHCWFFGLLRWLDWIFWGWYLPTLSINYVSMSKDMEKRLPQLYYIQMKISYDLGFIAIGVAMAT